MDLADIKLPDRKSEQAERRVDLIPTGSTLLNLALSGSPYGGYPTGQVVNLVGDRDSGKTFLSWNMFAEVVRRPEFDDYILIFEDVEGKFRIPVEKLFGKAVSRVQVPRLEEAVITIEEFYKKINGLLNKKQPFIYVLDSFDALSDAEEMEKPELKREYPSKPRLFSMMLRKICGRLRNTNSFLLIVSQVRQNIGVTVGPKLTRSAGKALGHYCIQEIWLAMQGHLLKKEREVGVKVLAKTRKNHLIGKLRDARFEIIHDYGCDDASSMISFLLNEGFWKKSGNKVDPGNDFDFSYMQAKMTKEIEERGETDRLVGIVSDCWREIEKSIATDRKPRYE
jgi:RecA/RadA recombinase